MESNATLLKLSKEQILSNSEPLNENELIGIGTIGKVYKIKISNENKFLLKKLYLKNFLKILLLLL